MEHIDGWLHESVMHYVKQIDQIQKDKDITGHVVEIGVHHGKFFIPLALLNPNQQFCNIAVDLFSKQEENISQSGRGNEEIFNFHCNNNNVKNVVAIAANSLNLTPEPFTLENTGVRLFSVDGGHFKKEVMNDLILSASSIVDEGVIIVDDFQHPGWDDVFSTTLQFLKEQTDFKPFLMGGNKLFLCKKHCILYDNLSQTLTWNQYKQMVIMTSEARQLLKAQTLFQLYPTVQLFEEN